MNTDLKYLKSHGIVKNKEPLIQINSVDSSGQKILSAHNFIVENSLSNNT